MLRVSVEGSTRNRMVRYLQQAHENHITIEINRAQDPNVLDVWASHSNDLDDIQCASASLASGYKVALVVCMYELLKYFQEAFRKRELKQKLDEVKEHADV